MTNQHLILSNLKGLRTAKFSLLGPEESTYEVLFSTQTGNGDVLDPFDQYKFNQSYTSGDGEVNERDYNSSYWLVMVNEHSELTDGDNYIVFLEEK